MSDEFTKHVGLASVLTLALLALIPLSAKVARVPGLRTLAAAAGQLNNRDWSADDLHALAANYYEGIESKVHISHGADEDDYHLTYDFLRYELKPNLHRRYEAGMRVTNSFGMANPEYGYEKPPQTRRIALLGDSISLGPYGQDYVAKLEERLNRDHVLPDGQKIQLLNFSVPGYILVQKLDVAVEKAAKFHVDAYILQLSSQEIGGTARHLGRLVASGTDFKYEYLRQIARKSRLRTDDSRPVVNSKLEPFFQPMTRWAVEQIRNYAASNGASIVIALLPAVMDADITAADFNRLHEAIDGLGIPTLDLRDTFRFADFRELQVVPGLDIHPNARGHEMIFKDLYAKLQAQRDVLAALTGSGFTAKAKKY